VSAPVRIIRRRPAGSPVYLLDVTADRGDRTRVTGTLWDGVLNAAPQDDADGPSPVEALLAGVAGCFVRNLRWLADNRHIAFDRLRLRLAAERSDDPPAISEVRLEVEIRTDAEPARVVGAVERALETGTITRTVARAARFEFVLRINGAATPVRVPDWETPGTIEGPDR
jgi:uncharacterized OsmC-like protein